MEFLDYVIFVCFAGAAMGLVFLAAEGLFELINYLTKGKLKDYIVNFFEESDE